MKKIVAMLLALALTLCLSLSAFAESETPTVDKIKEAAADSRYGADYFYNLGNLSCMKQDWGAAVEAFKQSLLRNPGDMDAKENYAYAKQMLKNQEGGGGGQDQQDQQRAEYLRDDRRDGDARHAKPHAAYEDQIQNNVADARDHQE